VQRRRALVLAGADGAGAESRFLRAVANRASPRAYEAGHRLAARNEKLGRLVVVASGGLRMELAVWGGMGKRQQEEWIKEPAALLEGAEVGARADTEFGSAGNEPEESEREKQVGGVTLGIEDMVGVSGVLFAGREMGCIGDLVAEYPSVVYELDVQVQLIQVKWFCILRWITVAVYVD
jgi:hypothetical protein